MYNVAQVIDEKVHGQEGLPPLYHVLSRRPIAWT